jgi:SdpC family antimicrobial peptide
MRNIKLTWPLLALLSVSPSLLSLACGGGDTSNPSAQSGSTHAQLDGQTIFSGIFFGTGEVAQLLPEVWSQQANLAQTVKDDPQGVADKIDQVASNMKAAGWSDKSILHAQQVATQIRTGQTGTATNADQTASRDLLLGMIQDEDPTFFSRFAVGMQSGDPVKVDRSLTEARTFVKSVVEDLQAASEPSMDLAKRPPPGWVVAYGYLYVAAVATTVVVVLSVVALTLVFPLEPNQEPSRLGHDEVIDRLSRGLARQQ